MTKNRRPTKQQVERFLWNLAEIQKQPRERWCVFCGAKWKSADRSGSDRPCDCWKDKEGKP